MFVRFSILKLQQAGNYTEAKIIVKKEIAAGEVNRRTTKAGDLLRRSQVLAGSEQSDRQSSGVRNDNLLLLEFVAVLIGGIASRNPQCGAYATKREHASSPDIE